MANMVTLGFMTAFVDLVSKKAVRKAILENMPRGTEHKNIEAYEEGYKLGIKTLQKDKSFHSLAKEKKIRE